MQSPPKSQFFVRARTLQCLRLRIAGHTKCKCAFSAQINSSNIANMHCWNNAISIDIVVWWHYFIVWGVLLVYFLYILHDLYSRFSHRADGYFSDPTLDVRNACTKQVEIWRRHTTNTPQMIYNTINHL